MTKVFDRQLARASAETMREKRLELSALAIPLGRGWQPQQHAMADVLRDRPATIGAVIAKLETIRTIMHELPPSPANNRVAAFNDLYLTITKRVDGALGTEAHSPEFLEMLDVEFAKRYFTALDLWNHDDEDTPDVWEVLFKRAGDLAMSKLVAAMLGVNAHINHDLSLALIATWAELGPPRDNKIHPDYLLVNKIFYQEIPPLRRSFSTAWQLDLDHLVGPLDDWSQRVLVTVTRARAWEQGRRLWRIRANEADFRQAVRTMDRAASLLGEWMIVGDRLINDTGDMAFDGRHVLSHIFPGRDRPEPAADQVEGQVDRVKGRVEGRVEGQSIS
jgi:hypothetical protein